MRHAIFLIAMFVFAAIGPGPSPVLADGILQALPESEAWATFHVHFIRSNFKPKEEDGRFAIQVSGSETRDGKRFRRIKIELTGSSSDVPETATIRALVPEKELLKNHSLSNLLREVVVTANGNTIRSDGFDSRASQALPRPIRGLALTALNQSGWYRDGVKRKKSGSVSPRELEYQRGELTSGKGAFRDFVYTQDVTVVKDGVDNQVPFEFRSRQTVWPGENVPFGAAAVKIEESWFIDSELQGKRLVELTVVDFGVGARMPTE
jgi:hypothetical protein